MPPKQRSTDERGGPAAREASGAGLGDAARPAHGSAADEARLRRGLDLLDRDRLVNLLIEAASRHPDLVRQLKLESAQANDDMLGIASGVDTAFRITERLSPSGTLRYVDATGDVVRTLATLVSSGRAGAALPLLSHAVKLLCGAMRRADDDAGALRGLMSHLLHLHAAASAGVDPRPDQVALGTWLAELQLHGPEGVAVPLEDYAPVLGGAGLDVYRAAVSRAWEREPDDPRIRTAREGQARFDRDVPALVEVVGGDLRRAVQYARLARVLRDIGARGEAVAWAERGLREHPDGRSGSGLREFLVAEYADRGGDDDALALRRAALEGVPTLASYLGLREAARQAGSWDTDRATARSVLRERRPDEYIRALLADDDADTAWQEAARLPLHPRVWDELARRRADTRPGDAIPVLRRRIDEVLAAPSRENYRDAVRRLMHLREACRLSGQPAVFDEYLRHLTLDQRRRPAFLRELTEAGLLA